MTYQSPTTDFEHQAAVSDTLIKERAYALFWEQGCAKTKPVIDSFGRLFLAGEIDALLVVAPNGVHVNWALTEIPTHMDPALLARSSLHYWRSPKAVTKWHQRAVKSTVEHAKGPRMLMLSYDAMMTDRGRDAAWALLSTCRVMMVLDEASAVKNRKSKRAVRILKAGAYAVMRRLLEGTPVATGPFDVYAPVEFLDPRFWHRHGFGSFMAFKNYFGIWRKGTDSRNLDPKTGEPREFHFCVGYHHLDELYTILQKISSRLLKEDVLKHLPPKLYEKIYFDMSPEQQRLYDDMRQQTLVWLDSGEECGNCDGTGMVSMPGTDQEWRGECPVCNGARRVHRSSATANLAITRLLRLQQITCGYVPRDEGADTDEPLHIIPGVNPRLEALRQVVEHQTRKGIIWARFDYDIDLIMALAKELGKKAVRYDGQVSLDEKEAAKVAFQNGDADWFVAKAQSAGRGLTLHSAWWVAYYNNTFKLIERLQSEDRAHRAGLEHPVTYYDLIALGTVDESIVKNLRDKLNIASQILGDRLRSWL